MAVWQFNRGEWTEAYVFMRLLGDGRIYGASSELTKDDSTYIDIINIIREEPDKMLIFERFVDENIAISRLQKMTKVLKWSLHQSFLNMRKFCMTTSRLLLPTM